MGGMYRGEQKCLYDSLSRTPAGPRQGQAEQLSKSRKKILATMFKPFN